MAPEAPTLFCCDVIGKVINPAFDRIVGQGGQSRSQFVAQVAEYRRMIRDEYYSNRKPNLPFQEPLCRIAYLLSQVPAIAHLVEVVFDRDNGLKDWFISTCKNQNGISICTLGGGPGTEILGLTKWVERQQLPTNVLLNTLITDKVVQWGEDWVNLRNQIHCQLADRYGQNMESWPVRVEGKFSPVDLEAVPDPESLNLIGGHNLYIVSYVIAHIFSQFENFYEFMGRLISSAPSGSRFLFIDRAPNVEMFKFPIRQLENRGPIRLSEFVTAVTESPLDPEEQLSGLGRLYTEVCERSETSLHPRLRWNAFWVVGTKV